jgi:citrate lyase beta subunit
VRALDGPVADHRDEEGLRETCLLARSLSFDGKWCIHPAQIGTVNEVFSPTEREIEWAKKVVDAFEVANATGSGAISIGGQMIDAASIRMARNTLGFA